MILGCCFETSFTFIQGIISSVSSFYSVFRLIAHFIQVANYQSESQQKTDGVNGVSEERRTKGQFSKMWARLWKGMTSGLASNIRERLKGWEGGAVVWTLRRPVERCRDSEQKSPYQSCRAAVLQVLGQHFRQLPCQGTSIPTQMSTSLIAGAERAQRSPHQLFKAANWKWWVTSAHFPLAEAIHVALPNHKGLRKNPHMHLRGKENWKHWWETRTESNLCSFVLRCIPHPTLGHTRCCAMS